MFVGEVAALGTACLWGFSTFMHTDAAKLMGAWPLIVFRMPLVLFYNICIAIFLGTEWVIPTESIVWISVSGILGLCVADTLLYEGCTRIGARMGSIIWQMTPCVTAVVAYLTLGERLSLQNIAGMLIVIASVIYVVFKEKNADTVTVTPAEWRYGFILVLVSVFALGVSHVCIRKGLSYGLDPLIGSTMRIAAPLIGAWLAVILMGGSKTMFSRVTNSRKAMGIVLVASFFGTTIGNWMALLAMQYAKAGIAATLMGMSPFAVIAITAIKERTFPSSQVIAGVLTACLGSALLFI